MRIPGAAQHQVMRRRSGIFRKLSVCDDPGSAVQRFTPHCVREKLRSAFVMAGLVPAIHAFTRAV
jgi:hypothetical protein